MQQIMIMPKWLVKIGRALARVSDWVDNTFFPIPVTYYDIVVRSQRDIEACANDIRKQLEACKKMKDCWDVMDRIDDFGAVWGKSVQVNSTIDSLKLELKRKLAEIGGMYGL